MTHSPEYSQGLEKNNWFESKTFESTFSIPEWVQIPEATKQEFMKLSETAQEDIHAKIEASLAQLEQRINGVNQHTSIELAQSIHG